MMFVLCLLQNTANSCQLSLFVSILFVFFLTENGVDQFMLFIQSVLNSNTGTVLLSLGEIHTNKPSAVKLSYYRKQHFLFRRFLRRFEDQMLLGEKIKMY